MIDHDFVFSEIEICFGLMFYNLHVEIKGLTLGCIGYWDSTQRKDCAIYSRNYKMTSFDFFFLLSIILRFLVDLVKWKTIRQNTCWKFYTSDIVFFVSRPPRDHQIPVDVIPEQNGPTKMTFIFEIQKTRVLSPRNNLKMISKTLKWFIQI